MIPFNFIDHDGDFVSINSPLVETSITTETKPSRFLGFFVCNEEQSSELALRLETGRKIRFSFNTKLEARKFRRSLLDAYFKHMKIASSIVILH
jgi:hypothetical protein